MSPPDCGAAVPAGYVRVEVPGVRRAVAQMDQAAAIAAILRGHTLHEWAGAQPAARAMQGRAIAWAVSLPDGTRVVVRHSRHGGLLAPVTGDRFVAPTRAPHELAIALRLTRAGVPTPSIVAYATYPAAGPLERADVMTREVPNARDLGGELARGTTLASMWSVLSPLLATLAAAGAHHPDLNVKNILLSDTSTMCAWVLDVDRVRFGPRAVAAVRNAARLERSLTRWRVRYPDTITDGDLARLRSLGAMDVTP